MSQFISPLIVEPLADGKTWRVFQELLYHSDRLGETIKVNVGYEFDFASIPQYLWHIVGSPATGKHRRASVIHDKLIDRNKTLGKEEKLSRLQIDKVFYEAMIVDGVNWFKAKVLYAGVRANSIVRGIK